MSQYPEIIEHLDSIIVLARLKGYKVVEKKMAQNIYIIFSIDQERKGSIVYTYENNLTMSFEGDKFYLIKENSLINPTKEKALFHLKEFEASL